MWLIHSSAQIFSGILLSFSACAGNLPVPDFNSHVHGDHWLSNQAVKSVYPEIDIYAHAKTIAQSRTGEGVSWLMMQLTRSFTRGIEMVPTNRPAKRNDRIIIDGEEFIIHSLPVNV